MTRLGLLIRVGMAGFLLAVLGQAVLGILVASLEFVGLEQIQRSLLRASEAVYDPGIDLFYVITGSGEFGSVLVGLLSVMFAGLVYALGIGAACALYVGVVGCRATANPTRTNTDR